MHSIYAHQRRLRSFCTVGAPRVLHLARVAHGETDAAAPAIVFIHGLLGSGTNFRSITRHASLVPSAAIPVYMVDLPGHGASPWLPASEMRLPALANHVLHALLTQTPHRQFILCGHSLGGKVACALALMQPRHVVGLTVMDIAPRTYDGALPHWQAVRDVVEAAAALDPSSHRTRGSIDAALQPRISDAGMRGFLLQNLVADGAGYRWRVNLPAIRESMPAFAGFDVPYSAPADVPCAFVRGALSPFFTDADVPVTRSLFPRARFHVIDGAGHWLHADKPQQTLQTLSHIFQEHYAAGASVGHFAVSSSSRKAA